ncbi:MAG: aminopeptidase N [Acetobacteraceae bacterium]|nr:aminopeptidase N [Acetobacteraceae bacterium]
MSAALHPVRLVDYRRPEFLVDTVDLTFELDPAATIVRSRLSLRRNPVGNSGAPLKLDGEDLRLRKIALDGEALGPNRYTLDDGALLLPGVPDRFVLEIETQIAPKENTELSGLYTSGGNYYTQCEAEGFRRMTFFPDRPDVMARYTCTIVADREACPVLLSNGNPAGRGEDGARHWAKWVDPHPKPCYLFALVAGGLVSVTDRFRTCSGRSVDLAIWVRRGDEDRCGHALRSLKNAMAWDEEKFGREYDLSVFNIAAVSDFNMGAMENKGLNVFNTRYVLAKPETGTDSDYQGIETVIAHEYFHNWTGNRITCRDWFQLSLKEGLTVFRDQEFTADQGSAAVKRIADVRRLRAAQFPEDAGPLAHPVRPETYVKIDNFYTATVYQKGAEVIRMMQTLIGREAFRRGMDLYFERHDNQAVTIEDFAQCMQDASGVDLTEFKRWYSQAGTPELTVSDHYDPEQRRYTLFVTQRIPRFPEAPPLVIPLAMGLLDETGKELRSGMLHVTEGEQSFAFDDVAAKPTPSLLRGFSAPVKLKGLEPERLRFLAIHDTDPFVRWDSGQQYATGVLLGLSADPGKPVDAGLISAISATLDRAESDPAFAAEAIALPSESFLAEQIEEPDFDAIHAARERARAGIGAELRDRFRALYDGLEDTGEYRIDGISIGRRALRNTCLAYLASEAGPEGIRLAKAQFDARRNMTDVLAALAVLSSYDVPDRAVALAGFYQRWRDDPLVLDKWFALQAASPLPVTIETVRTLIAHPDFDWRNPNRVRSVVGSFSAGNHVRFHHKSGMGYRFLAEAITRLDPINAQVAARMVSPFGQWRRLDRGRRSLIRAELEQILAVPQLSQTTAEMVARSLG